MCSTKVRYLGEQLVMLSRFGDIWIGCTYIYTSDWSGSCSEEGPLFRSTLPRPLPISETLVLSLSPLPPPPTIALPPFVSGPSLASAAILPRYAPTASALLGGVAFHLLTRPFPGERGLLQSLLRIAVGRRSGVVDTATGRRRSACVDMATWDRRMG